MGRRQERRQAKKDRNLAAQAPPAEAHADPHLAAVRAAVAKIMAAKEPTAERADGMGDTSVKEVAATAADTGACVRGGPRANETRKQRSKPKVDKDLGNSNTGADDVDGGDFLVARRQVMEELGGAWFGVDHDTHLARMSNPTKAQLAHDHGTYTFGLMIHNRINKLRKSRRKREARRANRAMKKHSVA